MLIVWEDDGGTGFAAESTAASGVVMFRSTAARTLLTAVFALPFPIVAYGLDPVVVRTDSGVALDQYLTRFSDYGYSFSILAAMDGEVILRKAYGPELSVQSVFNVASLAKQFTAAAILKLAEEDKLSLSDPLNRFFPEAPAPFRSITIDHLLSHTAGISDDYGLYVAEPELEPSAFRRRIFARPLAQAPGSKWNYSNDGYALLGMIIQEASGMAFDAYLEETLFRQAGLQDTGFMGDEWPPFQRPRTFGGAQPSQPQENRWVGGLGASSVVTSPSDLYRWDRALHAGTIVSQESLQKLTEAKVSVVPAVLSYARGWWVRTVEINGVPRRNIFHSGREDDGANAWYSRFPDEGLVILFASHQSWENVALREALFSATRPSVLERLIHGGQVSVPPKATPASNLERFECDYRLADGSWLRVAASDGQLILEPHGQSAFDVLLPQGSDQLTREVLERATLRTQAIFEDLARGERDTFAAAVGESTDGSYLSPPAFDSFEVLGSYPRNRVTPQRKDVVTHVAISDSGNMRHMRVLWGAESLDNIFSGSSTIIPIFRQTSADGFSNFHPFIQEPAHIRFDNGTLRFASDEAMIGRCRRKQPPHLGQSTPAVSGARCAISAASSSPARTTAGCAPTRSM